MDKIQKEHVIAGVIGGVTSLIFLCFAKNIRKGCCKSASRCCTQVLTMESDKLPAAIGPYTKGKMIAFPNGSFLAYSSGQLGLDKDSGNLVSEDVEAQADKALQNLKSLAEDNGFDLEKHCVKNVVYLVDMGDFAKVNEVYKKYFTLDFPARTCIAVQALPKGGKVEIESVFFKPTEGKACC